MCFGTFDVLHPGHLSYFRQALEFGDYLIVVVARDKISEKIKGRKPGNNEKKRLRKVKDLEMVDKAVLGSLSDRFKVIEKEKPDVVCFGYDQEVDGELVGKIKEKGIEIKRLKAYKPKEYKSSLIKQNGIYSQY